MPKSCITELEKVPCADLLLADQTQKEKQKQISPGAAQRKETGHSHHRDSRQSVCRLIARKEQKGGEPSLNLSFLTP